MCDSARLELLECVLFTVCYIENKCGAEKGMFVTLLLWFMLARVVVGWRFNLHAGCDTSGGGEIFAVI